MHPKFYFKDMVPSHHNVKNVVLQDESRAGLGTSNLQNFRQSWAAATEEVRCISIDDSGKNSDTAPRSTWINIIQTCPFFDPVLACV